MGADDMLADGEDERARTLSDLAATTSLSTADVIALANACPGPGHLACPTCRPSIARCAANTGRTFDEVAALVLQAEALTIERLEALHASTPPNRAARRRADRAIRSVPPYRGDDTAS